MNGLGIKKASSQTWQRQMALEYFYGQAIMGSSGVSLHIELIFLQPHAPLPCGAFALATIEREGGNKRIVSLACAYPGFGRKFAKSAKVRKNDPFLP
jgi:hypothetical protein